MSFILKHLFSSRRSGRVVDLVPTQIHHVETAQDRPSRALKHLLRLNHVNNAILWNHRHFDNHTPHVSMAFCFFGSCTADQSPQILCSSFLLGADEHMLHRIYESEASSLDPWADSPAEISTDDWRDYLGHREYVLHDSPFTWSPLTMLPKIRARVSGFLRR